MNLKSTKDRLDLKKDYDEDIRMILAQNEKLSDKLKDYITITDKSIDEMKKDMTHRDIFLCDEIDKVKGYTQEELFKMSEN